MEVPIHSTLVDQKAVAVMESLIPNSGWISHLRINGVNQPFQPAIEVRSGDRIECVVQGSPPEQRYVLRNRGPAPLTFVQRIRVRVAQWF